MGVHDVKRALLAILVLGTILLTGCDILFVDEEIQAIGKSGDYRDCASLDTSDNKDRVEECYSYVGKRQDDPNACRALPEKDSRRTLCFEDVAVDTNNEELCKEVEAQVNQRDCYSSIAANKQDPHLCRNLESVNQQLCYKDYAKKARDMDACLSIPHNEEVRDECFMQFIGEAKDESFCERLDLQQSRDDCYLGIAPKVQGNLLCEKISDDDKRAQCHIKMAVQLRSTDECNRLDPHASSREWQTCVTQVAVATLDSGLCDLIDDGSMASSCARQVHNANIQAGAAD